MSKLEFPEFGIMGAVVARLCSSLPENISFKIHRQLLYIASSDSSLEKKDFRPRIAGRYEGIVTPCDGDREGHE